MVLVIDDIKRIRNWYIIFRNILYSVLVYREILKL